MTRRYRTVTEQLGAIVIAFEVIVVMLVALTMFGLKTLPPAVALGGGAALIALFVLGILLLRYPWGRWYVLALQLVLTLCGVLEPTAAVVGLLFLAIWVFCMLRGGKIDAERAPIIAAYERERAAAEQVDDSTE